MVNLAIHCLLCMLIFSIIYLIKGLVNTCSRKAHGLGFGDLQYEPEPPD